MADAKIEDGPKKVIVTKDSSLRQKIAYVMVQVKNDQTVTLRAFGLNISKAITMATIVRERVGELNQITKMVTLEDPKTGRKGTGLEITISKLSLDEADVGYQSEMAKRPERPEGWVPKRKST